MKHKLKFTAILAACMIVLSSFAYAATMEGIVKDLNPKSKQMTIETEHGLMSVAYSEMTQWPVKITKPEQAVGSKVSITLDEGNTVSSVTMS